MGDLLPDLRSGCIRIGYRDEVACVSRRGCVRVVLRVEPMAAVALSDRVSPSTH